MVPPFENFSLHASNSEQKPSIKNRSTGPVKNRSTGQFTGRSIGKDFEIYFSGRENLDGSISGMEYGMEYGMEDF